jgi:hypothetical protein
MRTLQTIRNSLLAAGLLLCVAATASQADISLYSQNFETVEIDSADALSSDGWIVFGNVFTNPGGAWLYGYGTFPAPNGGEGFSAVIAGEGGVEQGDQQLSVYNDYNNLNEHNAGNNVQANVFRENIIGAADVGKTYVFQFDAKLGNLVSPTTAAGFIKTIDPNNNFALTNEVLIDMTSIPISWNTYSISLFIDAGLVGQLFQYGFLNTTTNFISSGVFYDNLVLREPKTSATPSPQSLFTLHQNVPNPFNPATRISFELQQDDAVHLRIYDVIGRQVTTLLQKRLGAGPHSVSWNGRMSNGDIAAAGIYRYVLETSTGRSSRSMVLLK